MFPFVFSVIVERIDEDKDSFVNLYELKNWIKFTQRRYIEDDVERQWKQHNIENTEELHWDVSIIYIIKISLLFDYQKFRFIFTIF